MLGRVPKIFLPLLLVVVLAGISVLAFVKNRYRLPLPALPSVTVISNSPAEVLKTVSGIRMQSGLAPLVTRPDLCGLGNDVLNRLKSKWQSGVFEAATRDFYAGHRDYSDLSLQAASLNLDREDKIEGWLGSQAVKKEILSPEYNSVCVVADGAYTIQVLGTYRELPVVLPTVRPTPVPKTPADNRPWGISRQIDEHTWTIRVGQDPVMAEPAGILDALNAYRRRHGSQVLAWDQKLAGYASSRAADISRQGKTDNHAGFIDFLDNQDGFNKLGFTFLGENMSYGYRLSGVHLIEWIYAGDEPHNTNQLDNRWNYVGIGVNGLANVLIFGTGRR